MNPHEIAEERVRLANRYSELTTELQIILSSKAMRWTEIRAGVKSDAQADRLWDATPEGQKENQIRLSLKAIDKQLSALRTMLEVLSGEARNQY